MRRLAKRQFFSLLIRGYLEVFSIQDERVGEGPLNIELSRLRSGIV